MKATIKDIARETNLSVATVSRILNNKTGYFSEKSAKKVLQVAKELGYQKNSAAVELVTKKSQVIAVMISSTQTNFANHIIEGIQKVALAKGLNVIILYAGEDDPELQKKALDTVIERSVMGILVIAIELESGNLGVLKRSGIPYLLLSTSHTDDADTQFITTDNFKMGYDATNYLIDHGHKRIAIVGSDHSDTGRLRIGGYEQAMVENGFIPDDDWIQYGHYTYTDGAKAVTKLRSKVTAILGSSDMVAVGALNQAKDNGINVPADLSIMSIDGTELTRFVRPRITAAAQPFETIGEKGVEQLLEKADGKQVESLQLGFEIVEGESVAVNEKESE
ncbi:LacI family DNA-binding transcriptional regulator [Lentilactobacillus sp. Marseille-Q4993]|uniref:LacI family DNA-binding transcriptional regulator n=1 Tax=Lentilactobacillus sp. Marseille-Q4993 TaxID=3039492 RepID=UPI0024BC6C56|nr:LacI family DNA-binding transcriptional regulator [Lentilactobacillus sp. Marseille-Q4993]